MARERSPYTALRNGIIDSKHVRAMGGAIWLYLYFLRKVNWETGDILGYTDGRASDDLGLSLPTIRKYRRILEGEYIRVTKHQYDQTIHIFKWVDPRTYKDTIYQSYTPVSVSNQSDTQTDTQTDTQSYTQPIGDRITPTSNLNNKLQIPQGDGSNFDNLQLAFMNATGIVYPPGQVVEKWAKDFQMLLKAGVEPEDITSAVAWLDEHDRQPVSPSQIITSALTAKRKRTSPAKPEEKPRMKKLKGANFETDPTDYRMVPA